MIRFYKNKATWLSIAIAIFAAGSSILGQSKPSPLLQDIKVVKDDSIPAENGSLVKKTTSSAPAATAPARYVKTSIPVLAEAAIPGYSGILVETLDGSVVVESGSEQTYNPASNVKIATAFAVLKTFGPEFRFSTNVWTDGSYEKETQTIHGNIYVSGKDPIFGYEHAIAIAQEMNRMGIRKVTGDLVVTDNFAMNYTTSATRSSTTLFASLNAAARPASAKTVYENYLIHSGKVIPSETPSVEFGGKVYTQSMPGNVNLLFSHESTKLREIVKATLCFSNNFLAERLGDMVGGPYAVGRIVRQHTGSSEAEFSIQTASGLGINRVTPQAMMKLLRGLRNELARFKMNFSDIMPVAGIDDGTLANRFDSDFATGSVIGKTGTMARTDGGVSALAGEINTRGGKLLFVIFNQRGSVSRFRSFQNSYVALIQGQFGGATHATYQPVSLAARLAQDRFSYPQIPKAGN